MKPKRFFLLAILFAIVFVNTSCKKNAVAPVNPVLPGNLPPVANAGPDQTITLPVNNTDLDGTGSNDPDNNILSYQWTKIAGPSSFTIGASAAVRTFVSNLVVGTYQLELTVTDNRGLIDKDTMQVTVNPVVIINQPPIANAGEDKAILLPVNNIMLDGTGSFDSENNISYFQWTKIAGPSAFTIANSTAAQTVVTNMASGVYEFELKVTDAGGLWSKDTMKVTVYGSSQEIIFYNQTWIFPWYSSIEINNFNSVVPGGNTYRIYIQRDTNPAWIEANPLGVYQSPGPYEYFIETRPGGAGMYTFGSLYIFYYGTDVSDTPNVKIVF